MELAWDPQLPAGSTAPPKLAELWAPWSPCPVRGGPGWCWALLNQGLLPQEALPPGLGSRGHMCWGIGGSALQGAAGLGSRDRSRPGYREAAWLPRIFLGLECHPLEGPPLGDAKSEQALENSRAPWPWRESGEGAGAGGSHMQAPRPFVGASSGISNYRSYFCPADYVVLALGERNESSHY